MTAETVSGAVPLLVTVTVCAALVVLTCWLPKSSPAAGASVAMSPAGAATPVPLSGTVSGLVSGSSEGTFRVALAGPTAVGLKTTVTAQSAPAARVPLEQVSAVTSNWSGLVPARVTAPVMVSGAPPLLLMVTVFAALVVPTCWLPKSSPPAGALLPMSPATGVQACTLRAVMARSSP